MYMLGVDMECVMQSKLILHLNLYVTGSAISPQSMLLWNIHIHNIHIHQFCCFTWKL